MSTQSTEKTIVEGLTERLHMHTERMGEILASITAERDRAFNESIPVILFGRSRPETLRPDALAEIVNREIQILTKHWDNF